MRTCRAARPRRGGATIVEVALLMSIFLMFLFGIMEYCRYLFMNTIATNAARDGARYAAVNVNNSTFTGTIITNDSTYPSTNPVFNVPSITSYVEARMGADTATETGGVLGMIAPRNSGGAIPRIQVYPCDSASLYSANPTFTPKAQSGSTATWNNADFTERLAVRVTGTYAPVLPGFLFMSNATTVELVVVMGSEG